MVHDNTESAHRWVQSEALGIAKMCDGEQKCEPHIKRSWEKMVKVIVTDRQGNETSIEFSGEKSLMQVIRDGGIEELSALCGGSCSCATCHVYIENEFVNILPPRSRDEDDLLDASSHRTNASRLSCQIMLSDKANGLRVIVAPED